MLLAVIVLPMVFDAEPRVSAPPDATLAIKPLKSSLTNVPSMNLVSAARGIPLRGEI